MDYSLIIVLVIVVALVLHVIGIYNNLVSLKNRFENAFAEIVENKAGMLGNP